MLAWFRRVLVVRGLIFRRVPIVQGLIFRRILVVRDVISVFWVSFWAVTGAGLGPWACLWGVEGSV